jgi:hypothetical protein
MLGDVKHRVDDLKVRHDDIARLSGKAVFDARKLFGCYLHVARSTYSMHLWN